MMQDQPILTVVVPAWNEAGNLRLCVMTLRSTLAELPHQIVIVNDGSTDATAQVAQELVAEGGGSVEVRTHAVNQGIGAGLRTGFGAARARHTILIPADFCLHPADWEPFKKALGTADVIVGCRRSRAGYNPLMKLNAWVYVQLTRWMFGLRLRDVNWICVYPTQLVQLAQITQRGIPMLVELLVRLRDLGASFCEVDCDMQPRLVGKPSASRFKVMWKTLTGLIHLWSSYRRPIR
jgi:glycosyltransferase involved in cell wall biosynthesis